MLGKLIRYDIKNIGKMTGFAYVILAVLSVLVLAAQGLRRCFSSNMAVRYFYVGMHAAFYFGLFLAFALLVVVIVEYILKNLFKDQGYLMHTLPVSSGSLMASKLAAAMFWSAIMTGCCYLCMAIVSQDIFWASKLISMIIQGEEGGGAVVAAVVFSGVSFYVNILCGIFMAASIGYSCFGKNKSVWVLLLCILSYIIDQVMGVAVQMVSLFLQYGSLAALKAAQSEDLPLAMAGQPIFCASVMYLVLAGIYSWIAVKRMKDHLNLD